MSSILHISDLHFGVAAPELADSLLHEIARINPDLLVVSGDLTQRGWLRQYRQAAAYLGQVSQAQLIVAGNHDGAYFNPIRRLFFPLARYQSLICDDLSPSFSGAGMHVLGVCSFRPFTSDWRSFWKNGRLDRRQIQQIVRAFAAAPTSACRILVVHHPLSNGRDDGSAGCIRGRQRLLAALGDCGVELVLSGHLHQPCARPVAPGPGRPPILCVNAGTAISTRLRGQPDSFNLLNIDAQNIGLTVHAWTGSAFAPQPAVTFARHLRA
jgi:3',5'-cyclic AMP phosphodiesterase CpdA